ncbi:SH3 domain containing protein [Histomonas meleagridis]|uniref:SH3 domain containing protein n=1 Tax=Histomonas meleagridis TaxID=135588 RepID=UPI00355A117A|nr:SH3 domain containing protein [Histomonas meleagridis]KAH0806654.1 SH3 domain containing protein [Histomonas meleagridis]
MEERLSYAKALEDACIKENELIFQYFLRLAPILNLDAKDHEKNYDILDNFLEIKEKSAKYNEPMICGYPGTIKDGIFNIAAIFAQINIQFSEISKTIQKQVSVAQDKIKQSITPEQVSRLFSEAEGVVNKNNAMIPMIKSFSEPYADLTKKIERSVSKLIQAKKPNAKSLAKLAKEYSEALAKRQEFSKKRKMLVDSTHISQEQYIQAITSYSGLLFNRDHFILIIFDQLSLAYEELKSYLQKSADTFGYCAKAIDKKGDFQRFAESKRIFRYNITCPDFEEIEFEFDKTKVSKEIKNEFPVGIAEVIENFICSGENEINCVKGKRLLLMEFPDDEWCCVMHPFTHAIGYVPSYCVNPISEVLGVCIREPKPGEYKGIVVGVGDFVAIMEDNPKEKMYKVSTARGDQGTISKGLVAIVYR